MAKHTVTELDAWQRCPQLWTYKYKMHLRPVDRLVSGPMISGRAIAVGLEAGLLVRSDVAPPIVALRAAMAFLEEKCEPAQYQRYQKGVVAALKAAPDWVWSIDLPQSELALTVDFSGDTRIVGKPDLWYFDDEGIHVIEFKSTSDKPEDSLEWHQIWNMQIFRYGVLLKNLYPNKPVYFRHIILSTRGGAAVGVEWPLSQELFALVQREMLSVARAIETQTAPQYHFGAHCKWCEYAPIDEVRLTGGDFEAVIRQDYKE